MVRAGAGFLKGVVKESARCTGSEATAVSDYMRTGLYAKPIIVLPVAIVLSVATFLI